MLPKFLSPIRRNLIPLSVLCISLLLTVISWRMVNRYEQRVVEQTFLQTAEEYQRLLERRIVTYAHFLDGLGALFSVDRTVTSQDFADYIGHINILDNYPGTKRIGYLPLVPVQSKASHEAQMRAAGFADYRIKSGAVQTEYYPYDYLYPFDNGARKDLLGVDEHNDPVRNEALKRARDWNQVVATGKLKKILVPSKQVSFLLYAPIYKKGVPHRTVTERRAAIKGYVYAAFRAEDLIKATWGGKFADTADVRFTVGNTPTSTGLLYESTQVKTISHHCTHCFKYINVFQAVGQQWSLELYPHLAFYNQYHERLSWVALACGILISLLVTALSVLFNEKRQRSAAQQEGDQQFRSLFDQNPDAVYAFDMNGNFVNANVTTLRLTGLSLAELKQCSVHQFIVPEQLSQSRRRVALAAQGIPSYGETATINAQGELVHLSVTNLPIVVNGKVIGIFGIAKDITQKRNAEMQNQQMRQFLDAVIENIPTTLFVKEAKTLRFISWNKAAEELTGISQDEVIGKTDYDLFTKQDADSHIAIDRAILTSNEPMDITKGSVQTRHHGIRLLHTRKVPFKMGDNQYLLGIAEDITERHQAEEDLKQVHAELEERVRQRTKALLEEIEARKESERALLESEEKYRAIFEQAPVGIAHIGLDGKWSKTNRKFAQIVGYSAEELALLSYADLTHPDDLTHSYEQVKRVIEDNTASISYEKRYIRKDGEFVWVNVTRSAIRSQSGNTLYYLSIIEDISQRKQAEAALRELTRHLQTAREDERTRIAREIHDELGGVLAAVKFDLSTPTRQNDLDQSGITKRNQETIKLVDHAIIALRRIMADLRPSVLDDLGLWAALEWQAGEFQSRMKIQTTYHLKGEEMDVEPDRATALFRMVQESLNNVAKHAQATEVRIIATTTHSDIIIRIQDNGRGISKDQKAKTKSFGLMGMRERAQAFGGVIKINGRPSEGTTVSIKIPKR